MAWHGMVCIWRVGVGMGLWALMARCFVECTKNGVGHKLAMAFGSGCLFEEDIPMGREMPGKGWVMHATEF